MHPPDHDWWPELPLHAVRSGHPTARTVVRELQGQLVEWRLLADRTGEPVLREALYRNLLAWQALLDEHQPDQYRRCRRCRSRWGRPVAWPCARIADVATALRRHVTLDLPADDGPTSAQRRSRHSGRDRR